MLTYTMQLRDLLIAESGQLETNINAETRLTGATLTKQMALLGPDAAEIAWRKQVSTDLEEIKLNLTLIKLQLGITNMPAGR
jgi:hypothetical protein